MEKLTYPRWVGVLLALLIPGSAHYLSGQKPAGIKWFLSLNLISIAGLNLAAVPAKGTILIGMTLILLFVPVLYLVLLCKSFRPVSRFRLKGWLILVVVYMASEIMQASIINISVEPYKMPTNSMQPTLNGITAGQSTNPTSLIDRLITGRRYQEVRAEAAGPIENIRRNHNGIEFTIGDKLHYLPPVALETFRLNHNAAKGEILWAGTILSGDHIMVEKYSYWFRKPMKGDVIVFKTDRIDHPYVRRDTIFIKRIAAVPGDTISISPPHILINGNPLSEPSIFRRLNYGSAGESALLPSDAVTLGKEEYFVMGDNIIAGMSLDSRHFGAIQKSSIIGRVSTIYWPFNRMGAVE